MLSPDLRPLEARLARLERENRRLRRGAVVAIIAASALAMIGAASPAPATLEAQEFVLKDSAGNIRARLGLTTLLYAAPPSPSPPASAADPLPLLDRERNAAPVPPIEVSTACLTFLSPRGGASAQQCSSWEAEAINTLSFWSGGRARVSLSSDPDASTLRIGETKSRNNPTVRGINVTLGAFADEAVVLVNAVGKGRTALKPGALEIEDHEGRITVSLPDIRQR